MVTPHNPLRGAESVVLRLPVLPKRVTTTLVSVSVVLFALHLFTSWVIESSLQSETRTRVLELFNMDNEVSIPTWWSQLLLVVAAFLVLCIAGGIDADAEQRRWRGYWFALAGIMLLVSMDEGVSIHEIAALPMRTYFSIDSGLLANAWVIAGLAVVAILVGFFFRFYLQLPVRMRISFAVAFTIFLLGAVGFEIFAAYAVTTGVGVTSWTVTIIQGCEELLEMLGATVFISALLNHPVLRQKAQATILAHERPSVL